MKKKKLTTSTNSYFCNLRGFNFLNRNSIFSYNTEAAADLAQALEEGN